MLRRLHHDQPESFAFTPDNQKWAEAQITKYPPGRQASAIIPLLWRAQEQEGWLSRPAIEAVASMLDMAYIRALEVATFYFMFQLQPVGSVAHIQICGTTSCMICGAEDLVAVCKDKIAARPHQLSADGKFSWEEVECLGACANAPMAQIGKDYYEDLTADKMGQIIDMLAKGDVPTPGPQNGRYAAEPKKGLTSLTEFDSGHTQYNASVQLAADHGDTVKRIDGSEAPILAPWGAAAPTFTEAPKRETSAAQKAEAATEKKQAKPATKSVDKPKAKPAAEIAESEPALLSEAREGGADDLKLLKGVGPGLEKTLNELGFFHFDQIADWTPEQVAWVDARLKFKGRIERDDWIGQAKILASGGTTEFANRSKSGNKKT